MDEIKVKTVLTDEDNLRFWIEKNDYMSRDILSDMDLGGKLTEDNIRYFFSPEYRAIIENRCSRETDRAYKVFFECGVKRIGFCLYCTYLSEDAKCFIIDYCIFPEYRNQGLGKACFHALREKTRAEGAVFYELNTHNKRAMRFWESLGFRYNGYDSRGSILLLLPPEKSDITYELLQEQDIWQVLNLENGYKAEIGEQFLGEEQQDKLTDAIRKGVIRFYVAKRETRVIGMCSVSRIFSTFQCTGSGIFEDFFIEPAFRKQGVARSLVSFVQADCAANGMSTLWVGASDTDKEMYKALGFDLELGTLLTWKNE